jgi:hypothetical protein
MSIYFPQGILDAMDECRRQMRFQRWDCTQPATVLHEPTITKHGKWLKGMGSRKNSYK